MAVRLKPEQFERVIGRQELLAGLQAAVIACDSAGRRTLLRAAKETAHAGVRAQLEGGGADGWRMARRLNQAVDEIVTALFDEAVGPAGRGGQRLALVAVGGYGRGELAPYSDLDLLFLHDGPNADFARLAIERMLFSLWDDLGVKVGHSVRTVDDCIARARDDHTIQTALLEARWVAGDQALAKDLTTRLRKDVLNRDHAGYIANKLRERDERHVRVGASRYMVEPNIKEGKGGMRDLHTLFWIAQRRYGFAAPKEYIDAGVLSPEQAAALLRARRFLWTVRCHLHFTAGRAEERLTFDMQPEVARRMGYAARAGASAVERFMKRYFLAAREVGALTRIICAKLEADNTKRAPTGLGRFLRRKRGAGSLAVPGFHIEGGRLNIDAADVLSNPANLMRLFEVAEERDLDLHPEAMEEATRRARRMPAAWRDDRAAQASFLKVAASPRNPAAALRLMNDAGVLGRFVPEFGRIVAQMQFNMHHHYTVDEHILHAVDAIAEIESGRHQDRHPLATSILPKVVNRRALYLAMLFHDIGKGAGDQQVEGEKAARAACSRLGLGGDELDLVAWLVRHHLEMSEVAQKRDISDARTIAAFAKLVGNVERLRLLLVLTVADMRAVGPAIWNDWKGQLLRDLYRLTEATLLGGRSEEEVRALLGELSEEAKQTLLRSAAHEPNEIEAWVAAHEDGYWLDHDAEAIAWHAAEGIAARRQSALLHVAARRRPRQGVTEVLIYAPDRAGLFASLAAAISAAGANIAGARVHTTKGGAALDIFSVQSAHHTPFGEDNPAALKALLERVRHAAVTDHLSPKAPAPSRRRSAFAIEPHISIDNDITPAATVVEASGRDRLGLLADLAQVCAGARVSIVSAHIDTAGERASDVFYVQEEGGGQISNLRRIAALRTKLEAVFRDYEPAATNDSAKPPAGPASTPG